MFLAALARGVKRGSRLRRQIRYGHAVHWTEIDARFPEPEPAPVPDRWSVGVPDYVAGMATRAARRALGLSGAPIGREELAAVVAVVTRDFLLLRDSHTVGLLALVGTVARDWDAVAACTGKQSLGARVVIAKRFSGDAMGLARHLATAVRGQLPAKHVMAAMSEVRELMAAGAIDARVAVMAAQVFVRDIVASADAVAATRAWLAGEEIEIVESAAPARAVADGEDPRIKIFERYAGELGDDAAIDRGLALLEPADLEPWHRYHERERAPIEDAVIRAFMARRPLPDSWNALVDPVVACWLGAEPRAQLSLEERLRDLARGRGLYTRVGRGDWSRAAEGLALGDVGRHEVLPFKPRRFFKDDTRKLLEYLAAAIHMRASVEDVEPAWLDFLARRSPETTPRIENDTFRWKHLLAVQSAITHRIGKQPREQVGAALQRIVTGV